MAGACSFDTDLEPGSRCVKERGRIEGYCAGGLFPATTTIASPTATRSTSVNRWATPVPSTPIVRGRTLLEGSRADRRGVREAALGTDPSGKFAEVKDANASVRPRTGHRYPSHHGANDQLVPAPQGHFWLWAPDDGAKEPPFEPGYGFLQDAVTAPVPENVDDEVLPFVRVLFKHSDGKYYWRGESLADFPRFGDLSEADHAAWRVWVAGESLPDVSRARRCEMPRPG